MHKLSELSYRKAVPIYTKMKPKPQEGKHLIRYKDEKEYDYYKCDYCGSEIKILNQKNKMTGGIVTLSRLVTKKSEMQLALCNKCLKPVLKIFEEGE